MKHKLDQPLRIAFLLGKPVREDSVFPTLFDLLREDSITTAVHLPKGDLPMPPWVFESAVVVQRGLGLTELRSARTLEETGIRCCNRISASITLQDRGLTAQRLVDAGLPVPATMRVATWAEVVERADGQPAVVKRDDGAAGRGLNILSAATGELPPLPPFPGPYIVQDYISSDGQDHKLYVAGDSVKGLLKQRTPGDSSDAAGVPVAVNAELSAIAQGVGQALELDIFGVDVLYGPSGPVIVDVNPFPGFRNIPGAPLLLARHLASLVTGRTAECNTPNTLRHPSPVGCNRSAAAFLARLLPPGLLRQEILPSSAQSAGSIVWYPASAPHGSS